MSIPLSGAYYHASNRGANGLAIFHERADYRRFLALLYIANNAGRFIMRDLRHEDAFLMGRPRILVDVAAYCILPDRYRIVYCEREPGGGRRFVHKLATAYAMYYNRRYRHRGTLFAGSSNAERIAGGRRLREVIRSVHLEPDVEAGGDLRARAPDGPGEYEYSSMLDYLGTDRLERAILSESLRPAEDGL